MTDLTDAQRIERSRQAALALEHFLDPAFAVLREEYGARLEQICATSPWDAPKISALANATRILSEVRNQIAFLVADGADARRTKERAERIEKMTPAKRRLLGIAPV